MAISSKAGSFTGSNATGNQAVTGVGFQPKFLVLMTVSTADNAIANSGRLILGFASGSSDQQAFDIRDEDAQGTTNTARSQQSGKILSIVNLSADTVLVSASLVSFDSDGFTINWANATAAVVHYFAIAGSDFQAKVGSFDMNGSTGNQAVTGVGFQPKAVMFFGTIDNTTEGAQSQAKLSMGCATATNERWACSVYDQDSLGATNSIAKEYITESKCIIRNDASSVTLAADLVSLDSDGFTVNITTALACRMIYVAFGGSADYHAGTVTALTIAGNSAESGIGQTPACLLFAGVGASALDTISNNCFPTFGVCDGALQEEVATMFVLNNAGISDSRRDQGSGSCIERLNLSSSLVDSTAGVQSFDSDGFTLNWTNTDGTASIHGYLAIGTAPVAGVVHPFVFVIT